jgi:hypothetical protein
MQQQQERRGFERVKQRKVLIRDNRWTVVDYYDTNKQYFDVELSKWSYNASCLSIYRDAKTNAIKQRAVEYAMGESHIMSNVVVKNVKTGATVSSVQFLDALSDEGLILSSEDSVVVLKHDDYSITGDIVRKKTCRIVTNDANAGPTEDSNPFLVINGKMAQSSSKTSTYCVIYDIPVSLQYQNANDDAMGDSRCTFDVGVGGSDVWLKDVHFEKNIATETLRAAIPTTFKQKKAFAKHVVESNKCGEDRTTDIKSKLNPKWHSKLNITYARDAKEDVLFDYLQGEITFDLYKNAYYVETDVDVESNVVFYMETSENQKRYGDDATNRMNALWVDWASDAFFKTTNASSKHEESRSRSSHAMMASIQQESPEAETSAAPSDVTEFAPTRSKKGSTSGLLVVPRTDPDIIVVDAEESPIETNPKTKSKTTIDRKTADVMEDYARLLFGPDCIACERNDDRSFGGGEVTTLKGSQIAIPYVPLFQSVTSVVDISETTVIRDSEESKKRPLGKITNAERRDCAFLHQLLIMDVVPKCETLNDRVLVSYFLNKRRELNLLKHEKRNDFGRVRETEVKDEWQRNIKSRTPSSAYRVTRGGDYGDIVEKKSIWSASECSGYPYKSVENARIFECFDEFPNEVWGSQNMNDRSIVLTVDAFEENDDVRQNVTLKTIRQEKTKKPSNRSESSTVSSEKKNDDKNDDDFQSTLLLSVGRDDGSSGESKSKMRRSVANVSKYKHELTVRGALLRHFNTKDIDRRSDPLKIAPKDSECLGYIVMCHANKIVTTTTTTTTTKKANEEKQQSPSELTVRSAHRVLKIKNDEDDEYVKFLKKRYAQFLIWHVKTCQPDFFQYCLKKDKDSSLATISSSPSLNWEDDEDGEEGRGMLSLFLESNPNDVFDRWVSLSNVKTTFKNTIYDYDAFLNQFFFKNIVVFPLCESCLTNVTVDYYDQFSTYANENNMLGNDKKFDSYRYYVWEMQLFYKTVETEWS